VGTEPKTYLLGTTVATIPQMCGTETPYDVFTIPLLINKSNSTPSHHSTNPHIFIPAFWTPLRA